MRWQWIRKNLKTYSIILILLVLGLVAIGWARAHVATICPRTGKGVTWNNLTVGVSTEQQAVAELGPPDEVTKYAYLYYYSEWHREKESPSYSIRFNERDIIFEIVDYLEPISNRAYLSEFIEQYGPPDYVTWAELSISPEARIAVYLDEGILLIVYGNPSPEKSDVIEIHYFLPCSLECVKYSYFYLFSDGPNEWGAGGIDTYPADPWGFTSGQ